MSPRRNLLAGGALAGALAAAFEGESAAEPVAGAADLSDVALDRVTRAITGIENEVRTQRQFTEIAAVRDAQKTFLRANGKFPDFIDVGADIWLNAHDWHVRWMQPMTLGRDAQGRYTITLLGTTLVLRVDATANFVGIPYEGR